MEIPKTNSEITQKQQDDPLSLAVKTTFNSIQELQDLAAPEAVCVESTTAEPQVEGSITDISHAHVNLPDEANLPVQSAHHPDCPSVANSPPVEVEVANSPPLEIEVASQQVETQADAQMNDKENLDDAQRAAFTQECSLQPLMSQDAYQITLQLYKGRLFSLKLFLYRFI